MKYIFIFLIFITQFSFASEDKLVISFSGLENSNQVFKVAEKLMKRVEELSGIQVELLNLPNLRAEKYFRNGQIDAEMARDESYKKILGDSIMIPFIELDYHVYTALDLEGIKDWNSLKPYSIGCIRGSAFIKQYLPSYDNLIFFESLGRVLDSVAAKQTDLLVSNSYVIDLMIKKRSIRYKKIKKIQPRIDRLQFYTFFRKDKQKLAKRYEEVLSLMKKDGSFQKIIEGK